MCRARYSQEPYLYVYIPEEFLKIICDWKANSDGEPREFPLESVGFSEHNRDINILYAHGLCKNINGDGYDPKKAKVGCVIRLDSPAGRAALVKRNQDARLAKPHLWPPLIPELMKMACLGGNHFTICLYMFKAGVVNPSTNTPYKPEDDVELETKLKDGHKYWELIETTPIAAQRLVAEWLNSEQMQSYAMGEAPSSVFFFCFTIICQFGIKQSLSKAGNGCINKFNVYPLTAWLALHTESLTWNVCEAIQS